MFQYMKYLCSYLFSYLLYRNVLLETIKWAKYFSYGIID